MDPTAEHWSTPNIWRLSKVRVASTRDTECPVSWEENEETMVSWRQQKMLQEGEWLKVTEYWWAIE